jgi:hypothetical protein
MLNPEEAPEAVRELHALAERWGISDDGYRAHAARDASTADLESLIAAIDDSDYAALEEWLAGPAADDPSPSDEYIAFTCLVMACDQARLELERRDRGRL